MASVIGIDTGGTFTDVTILDRTTGTIRTAKVPTTPDDPSRGFADGVRAGIGERSADIDRVLHGTTVATNLILESKGPRIAMLVTDGFRSVLEIGRQDIPRGNSLFAWVKPKRPVPPHDIWGIPGRLDPDGSEVAPLDEAAVRAAARAIRAAGIEAVAVVFLHSYANPAHERRAAAILAQEHPDALISLSSEVLPVFREYERAMTTVLNVYVMPAVASYVGRLEQRLSEQSIAAPLLLMKSSGGVTSARSVRRTPVETALSGPAAGVVGMNFIGTSAGFRNLIGIDIGGTSADISLIDGGQPNMTTAGLIGDWPIGRPMLDITTIGAGGGSIARVSASGALTVGPESAGAVPGPVCYGHGGSEPTVTDAHLVLGHLPPHLLGGSFRLDAAAARDAIARRIAAPLGMDVEAAARGILAIADHNMTGAIRVVSVERGYDPRDLVLVPFGGAGPLHGGSLARLMGIGTILVPPAPGVLSALGLLVSNLRAEFTRTCLQRPGSVNLAQLAEVFTALQDEARTWLHDEAVPPEAGHITWHASMRYQHQGFELVVPWAGTSVDAASVAASIERFHRLHERLYTFAQEDTPVEIVTLRVDAEGIFPPPSLPELPKGGRPGDAVMGEQSIAFAEGRRRAPVYDRTLLGAGDRIAGPAVLTQLDATTLLLPGQTAEVHRLGSLIVREDAV
ncbi:MAG: hydantoinase/oxoprolinase family protein [Proteobacteria bacterium]|nr:hydantoinase/oxoprolinase family protein [Pseudomonadota bacterium]